MKRRYDVTVTTSNAGDVRHDGWPTEAKPDRQGALRIYEGIHQRAYYPPGTWTAYTVALPAPVGPPADFDG